MSDDLIHTIYASRAAPGFNPSTLPAMMEQARSNNVQFNLTGMLLYCEGSFFQVLEGSAKDVANVYEKISQDDRHDQLVKIIEEAIPERSFANWSMGLTTLTRDELQSVDGFNDFFQTGSCLTDVDFGRSRKLLKAFAVGRWRAA